MNDKSDTKHLAEALANLASTITEIIDQKVRAAHTGTTTGPETGGIKALSPAEGWVSLQETADHLKVSRRTLSEWMKRGYVPYVKIGKGIRFKLSEVDEAMKRRAEVHARY